MPSRPCRRVVCAACSPPTVASRWPRPHAALDSGVVLLIGPEGGLADNERRFAGANGFAAYRLGPRILRTETAGLAALAALQAMAGDFA